MSCNCDITGSDSEFACTCDDTNFPPALKIGAGLTDLPRQTGTFAQFRQSMLYALRSKGPLASWQARAGDDLGVMMLEMWAYVCDVLCFYDKVIAQEEYITTAKQRASVRKLLALLSYLPAPAVAATGQLAVLADGRLPVTLPAGTSFRSSAFDGNPPQVFQLMNDTQVDPLANHWVIAAPHLGQVTESNRSFMLVLPQITLKPGTLLLLSNSINPAQNQVVKVSQAGSYTGNDGVTYTKIIFVSPHTIPEGTLFAQLQLLKPTKTAVISSLSPSTTSFGPDTLNLDTIYRQIQSGDTIIVDGQSTASGRESRWFSVNKISEISVTGSSSSITINGSVFSIPGITSTVSAVLLDTYLNNSSRAGASASNWTDPATAQLVVYYGLQSIGTITDEAKATLSSGDPFYLAGKVESTTISPPPSSFMFSDINSASALLLGEIDFTANQLNPNQAQILNPAMVNPVDVYGNVILVNRGERVPNEIIGSGDPTQINQTFKLKKKPLTYLSSLSPDNSQGIQNTLTVYVNNIRWAEVPGFYNAMPTDQIYIVRQNDDGDSLVTFGDGVRGACLPAGTNNVVAFYQFGAGKASPPAGSISQIAKPVKGLKSVKNPLAVAGGADAEPANKMSINGPGSVLILGRAVSIQDFEAVALSVQGVRAVQAEWRWQKTRQQPLVHVWYIGEAGLANNVSQRLHNLADPTTPIFVENANGVPATLSLSVQIDPAYMENTVLAALRKALTNTANGVLAPENLGIGLPLFRSRVFAAVLAVEGTLSVDGIFLNKVAFIEFGKKPVAGTYFDFENGSLVLNGKAS